MLADKLKEVLENQRKLATQKFYVSFDETGRITSVFASSDGPQENSIVIENSLAEGFLNGELMKTKYVVAKIGDEYALQKIEQQFNLTASSSFYKAPTAKQNITLLINKQKKTLTVMNSGNLDGSAVFYICEKNCFHKVKKQIVYDATTDVYALDNTENIDVYVPAHIKDVGVQYE